MPPCVSSQFPGQARRMVDHLPVRQRDSRNRKAQKNLERQGHNGKGLHFIDWSQPDLNPVNDTGGKWRRIRQARSKRRAISVMVQGSDTKMFLFRSAFWLGLALLITQPHGFGLFDSAEKLGTAAVETGRSVALDSLDQVACTSMECAGAKLLAQSALSTSRTTGAQMDVPAPYPAPAPTERRI